MSDEQQDERPDEAVEDLEVDQAQADDITGGREPKPISIIKVYDKSSPKLLP